MKAKLLLSALFGLTFSLAGAQTFINGSLEGGAVPCSRVYNFQFPTFVGNAGFAFGTAMNGPYPGMIYFNDGTCLEGAPKHGSNYLGLGANDAGLVDAIALRMDAPLLANKNYTLTFYTKKSSKPTPKPIALQVGYSNDSLKFGTVVDAVQTTSATWTQQTVYIKPTTTSKYVTIRGVQSSFGTFEYGYTWIDSFTIKAGGGTNVAPLKNLLSSEPHPNPFLSQLSLNLTSDAKLPCKFSLTDVTGRVVSSGQINTANPIIQRGSISAGIYLLQIEDADGARGYSRVIAE